MLSIETVSAQQAPLPVPVRPFPNKTRNLSLLPAKTVSAKQGPLPGQVAVCRHRTVTPNPVLVNPESFMETSWSAGALSRILENWQKQFYLLVLHMGRNVHAWDICIKYYTMHFFPKFLIIFIINIRLLTYY